MRKAKRVSKIYFFLPIVLIGGLILYSYLVFFIPKPTVGMVILKAEVVSSYYKPKEIHVKVNIGGETYTTPSNVSLKPGLYSISFSNMKGFISPKGCNLNLVAGAEVYCVGDYTPIPDIIILRNGSFEPNKTYAYSGITPVIWVNNNSNYSVLNIEPLGRIIIPPNQNFTYVYNSQGIYNFEYFFSHVSGQVIVTNLP